MQRLVHRAFQAQHAAATVVATLPPQMPILFFGDLDKYLASPLRVITVALNPSHEEFPAGNPFERFSKWRPLAGRTLSPSTCAAYLAAISGYFANGNPAYWKWFRHLEPVLEGFDASFRPWLTGKTNAALHTDLLSPVATSEKWGVISRTRSTAALQLTASGVPLWHALVSELRPHIALLSFAMRYRDYVTFPGRGNWSHIHTNLARKPPNGAFYHRVTTVPGATATDSPFDMDLVYGHPLVQPFGGNSNSFKSSLAADLKGKGLANWP